MAVILAAAMLAACGGSGTSPDAVGRGFIEAICTGEFERAYGLLQPSEREFAVGPMSEFVREGQELLSLADDRLCTVRESLGFRAFAPDYGVLTLELEALSGALGMPTGTTEEIEVELVRVDGDWYVDPYAAGF